MTAAVAVGCSSSGGSSGGPPPAGGTPATKSPATTSAPTSRGPAHTGVIVTGLRSAWGEAFLPDGTALIAERDSGRILRLGPGTATARPVMTIPGVVHDGESGLLGLAASPHYADDHWVYAYYTTASDNRIARFRLGGAPQPILTGLNKAMFHDGGRITFGPDGMLYAGVGDATNRPDAQDRAKLNGKILRMRPDGSVPPDNPFPGSLVYSLGHRNVQGLAFDAAGRLWATEFGQDTWDEVNLIQAGHNYGWPVVEGKGDTHGGMYTNPLVTWRTADASPSGAAIVGSTLYVAALRGERLWKIPLHGTSVGTPQALFTGTYGRIRTVIVAPDGALWFTTANTDGRGNPRPGDDRIVAIAP